MASHKYVVADGPITDQAKETIEEHGLEWSDWMDIGGRFNLVLWGEDYAVSLITHGETYEVVSVATLETIEDSYYGEDQMLEQRSTERHLPDAEMTAVFQDLAAYTDIATYLNERQIVAPGVNDGKLDAVRRFLSG